MSEKPRQKTAIVMVIEAVRTYPPHQSNESSPGTRVGGVSTAAGLAKADFSVTVLEKNALTGGRCSLIHYEGYCFRGGKRCGGVLVARQGA
jgi:hypothetical protein